MPTTRYLPSKIITNIEKRAKCPIEKKIIITNIIRQCRKASLPSSLNISN
jgi:hypothetical protein